MLLCDNIEFYIGIAHNVSERLLKHKTKKSLATKEFSDIKIVYCEKYADKYLAAKREKQLKGWSKAKKQMLISGKLGINRCTEFVQV